ncbi:tRNA-specific adenosine deaminase subunit tad3 [Coemansia javaensis]|uniref:tRNA-specific adenosine deaminase subunit tad3 n=1 Tax=Coemansia javaensis TaxID=2761396 RepID=A0A9W8HL46_9FUNG|nr:tRNA-specific adenosine deaminase subunit tad3 [Coemansia javaensis]
MAEGARCGRYLVERVPIEEERQSLETEDVFTARITAQQASRILGFVGKALPRLDGIEHVKRVRREGHGAAASLQVILCQCRLLERAQLDARIQSTEWADLDIAVSKVPTTPAYTKDQFDRWRAVWPVAYRPLAKLKKPEFGERDQEYIDAALRLVQQLCDQGGGDGRAAGVAIGDPQARRVVAQAADATSESGNPLRHATMCCIAHMADREAGREAGEPGGHLCEGLDVFASREPCVMCAMALVHSRIGRLFFLEPRDSGGISHYSIHSRQQLNHHFTCFRCVGAADG